MKAKTSFELFRWFRHVILFFIGTSLIMLISELAIGPGAQWLLHGVPYQLPTWNRAGRMALVVLFIGFFAGTLSWYYEKRSSGR